MVDSVSSQALNWTQSGTALWDVTADVASNVQTDAASYGHTRMVHAITVTNQQMGRTGSDVKVEAS